MTLTNWNLISLRLCLYCPVLLDITARKWAEASLAGKILPLGLLKYLGEKFLTASSQLQKYVLLFKQN